MHCVLLVWRSVLTQSHCTVKPILKVILLCSCKATSHTMMSLSPTSTRSGLQHMLIRFSSAMLAECLQELSSQMVLHLYAMPSADQMGSNLGGACNAFSKWTGFAALPMAGM